MRIIPPLLLLSLSGCVGIYNDCGNILLRMDEGIGFSPGSGPAVTTGQSRPQAVANPALAPTVSCAEKNPGAPEEGNGG